MKRNILLISLSLLCLNGFAQETEARTDKPSRWEFEIRAGFNIGGTSPLPLPQEIRKIESYSPTIALSVEGNVTHWLDANHTWGILTGIRWENKGMKTQARVKNYGMEIIGSDGNRLKGNWTGRVNTRVSHTLLTFPLLGVWQRGGFRWKAGPYFSIVTDGTFDGRVSDGYLRKDNPTGDKVNFTDGASASYDFSDELRTLQWGILAGADWQFARHFKVYADLNWGLSDIFHSRFRTITFAMYPIYLNIGFGYCF